MTTDQREPRFKKPRLRRTKTRRSRRQRRRQAARMGALALDLLPLLLLLLALAILLAPVLAAQTQLGAALERLELAWLGRVLLLLSLILGFSRVRRRVNDHQPWWSRHGCPSCGSRDLKRSPRRAGDRLVGRLGVPARRYVCADCGWRGRRIDESRVY